MQSLKQFFLIVGLAGFCSFASAPMAKADVLYNLGGISFNDGGNLSGTFSVNVYGQVAGPPFGSAYSLTTTTGSILTGNIYQSGQIPSAFLPNPPDLVVTFQDYKSGTDYVLNLAFSNPLGSPGPNTLLGGIGGPSYECIGFSCPASGPIRYVSEDVSVTGVPEPSTWVMMVLGFLGIGLAAHRRSSRLSLRFA